jgi:arylsulfatase A-like enzyme
MKSAGYTTACIGKWHLGHLPEFLPTKHGFDYYFGLPYSNDMYSKRPGNPPLPLIRGEKTIETEPDQSLLTKRYTEEAIGFIKQNKEKPFFVYLPHTMIHEPLAASEAFKGKSASGLLGDVIEEIDWSVGQVMKTIKELGLDEKTLVIFTSDNGPDMGSAGPFKGKKGSNFEGGVREPCIMRWPGKIPAGTQCSQIAGNIDVLPTLASIAGAKLDPKKIIDGRDISTLMMDDKAGPVRDVHLYCTANLANPVQAIRMGEWKLFLPDSDEGGAAKKKKGNAPQGNMLFNLEKDPGETTNVFDKNPEIVEKLRKEARTRISEILANRRPVGVAASSK